MLEITVARGVEGDDNRHSLTERKLRLTAAKALALSNLSLVPKGFELLAKVIHVAEQSRKIHGYPLLFSFPCRELWRGYFFGTISITP